MRFDNATSKLLRSSLFFISAATSVQNISEIHDAFHLIPLPCLHGSAQFSDGIPIETGAPSFLIDAVRNIGVLQVGNQPKHEGRSGRRIGMREQSEQPP